MVGSSSENRRQIHFNISKPSTTGSASEKNSADTGGNLADRGYPSTLNDQNKGKLPEKPSTKAPDSDWAALFPGFSRLNADEKKGFKNAIAEMNEDSWKFWMQPLTTFDGQSRAQAYTFPMDSSQHDYTSFNFGDSRSEGSRSHAAIDIYGFGGNGDKRKKGQKADGHRALASTAGTVVHVADFYKGTKRVTIVNDDGSVIDYTEIIEAKGIVAGKKVKPGDIIGETKKMDTDSMIHIEIYNGDSSDVIAAISAEKKGTDTAILSANEQDMDYVNGNKYDSKPFKRREDLHDPAIFGALKYSKK